MVESERPSKIVDNAFNDYIRAWNAARNARPLKDAPESAQAAHDAEVQLDAARRRYAKALADYMIGGDPEWYMRGGSMV